MLKVLMVLMSCLTLGLMTECNASSLAEQWAKVTKPSIYSGNAQSIGSYTAGCVSGAVSLPINGSGFQMMRLSRK
ncbi:MAG: penicillin-insensitive murein endopeptidase, partial [Methylococcaceae bacterium]